MMKISLDWINDYIDVKDLDKKVLADKITFSGINVEKVTEYKFNNLVVGQIIKCDKHPKSDHLNICIVDVGEEKPLQIICGADNVKEGIKVIVSLIGAILPGDFVIETRTLAGLESTGMICALYELELADKEKTYDDGIHVLPEESIIGDNPLKYLGLEDTIYDLDLNPNRSDCLSHIGFAYEIGAVTGNKVTLPKNEYKETSGEINDNLKLSVSTKNVPLVYFKEVKDVVIKETPDFIKKRLEAVGMRSINNVVDISNYVMLEYGQPLHFYDRDKIGNQIGIRMAKEGEKIITLDKQERNLNEDDIVITDGEKPVSIAGVMGCLNSEVTPSTKNILIESAIFNPYNIRYTSIKLDLVSEASLRNSKILNFEYTKESIDRACHLLEKYAEGKVVQGIVVYDDVKDKIKKVTLDKERMNKVLGIEVPKEEITKILNNLEFSFKEDKGIYDITIPNRRIDVTIKEGIIEEISRLYGFDKLNLTLPNINNTVGGYKGDLKIKKDISKRLRSLNLNEVKTYTLVSEEESKLFNNDDHIQLLKPMAQDKSYIRTSLISSLLKVYDYNVARGLKDINIYEIANVYNNDENYTQNTKCTMLMSGNYINYNFNNVGIENDFYVIKGLVNNLLSYLGLQNRTKYIKQETEGLHPGISAKITVDNQEIGFIGKVHPKLTNDNIFVCELDLNQIMSKKTAKIKFPQISKYPEIQKDVSFILDKKVLANDVLLTIRKNGSKILNNVKIFDVYTGDKVESSKKSIAFNLTFVDFSKTLTEEEVDKVFRDIIAKVCKMYKADIRDK